ncbi:MAG: vanadium-dependent haloperoxidase [Longimicrobiales bacterium]
MSRIVTFRTGHTSAARALAAFVLLACSEQVDSPVSPPSDIAANFSPSTTPPATIGWHEQARALVAANRFSTLSAERVYAVLSVAQYAAIDKTDIHNRRDGTIPDHGFGPGGRARFELERGVVTGASWPVLSFFFPTAEPALKELVRAEATARGWTHPHFLLGLAIGVAVANKMIERTENDRFTVPFTGTIPVGPGFWIPNGPPVGATGANVLPFLLTSASQFRSPPPPAFQSPAFLTDLAEIKTLSDTRTAEQAAIARFWAFPAGTFTSTGYWNQLAGNYVAQYRLNERAAAHVFALLHAAMFDANVVACFDAKYTYWYIRPVQADPTITLAIGMPNHPSYPSGHSCAAAAAANVLAHFFPDRAGDLQAQVTEAGLSRMYGGLHYRFDITAGQALGRAVALNAINIDRRKGILSEIF